VDVWKSNVCALQAAAEDSPYSIYTSFLEASLMRPPGAAAFGLKRVICAPDVFAEAAHFELSAPDCPSPCFSLACPLLPLASSNVLLDRNITHPI